MHVSLGQAVVYLRVKLIGIDLLYDRYFHETAEHTSHMTSLKHTASLGYFNLLPHSQILFSHFIYLRSSQALTPALYTSPGLQCFCTANASSRSLLRTTGKLQSFAIMRL